MTAAAATVTLVKCWNRMLVSLDCSLDSVVEHY